MDWLNILTNALNYIENHLLEEIDVVDLAKHLAISPFYLQYGFKVITSYTISEYIRNRRLYLAASDLVNNDERIIDLAYKYGYETPEAFSKAFQRFHGVSPIKVRNGADYKSFLRINMEIKISQGENMDVKITPLFGLKLIGFKKEFSFEDSYEKIPKFWDEICEKHCQRIYSGLDPETDEEKAIVDNCIGEYAICLDNKTDGKYFDYMVAGRYCGGDVPNGMDLVELERGEWAIFDCYGPNPATLQSVNTKVFKEWLPNNKEYEIRAPYNIEWYDCTADMTDPNYHSQIWVPVKKK